jgi:hypothetical protein
MLPAIKRHVDVPPCRPLVYELADAMRRQAEHAHIVTGTVRCVIRLRRTVHVLRKVGSEKRAAHHEAADAAAHES